MILRKTQINYTRRIPHKTVAANILEMPKPPESSVFTRTGNTAGNQEMVEKLVFQWKGKGVEITVGPKRITFITPPEHQKAGELLRKEFRAQMEKDGLWEDWKEGI